MRGVRAINITKEGSEGNLGSPQKLNSIENNLKMRQK